MVRIVKERRLILGKLGKAVYFLLPVRQDPVRQPSLTPYALRYMARRVAMFGRRSSCAVSSQIPEMMTEVELVFELKKIVYHIHRIPKQPKPKTRGDGFTEQKSEATLIVDTKGERKVIYRRYER